MTTLKQGRSKRLDKMSKDWQRDDVTRAERRSRAEVAAQVVEPMWGRDLTSFGVARVSPTSTRWFAYKCVDGNVTPLTPLHAGELRGEGKPNATGRLKMALLKHLGGVDV